MPAISGSGQFTSGPPASPDDRGRRGADEKAVMVWHEENLFGRATPSSLRIGQAANS